jgi:hypothetical protein
VRSPSDIERGAASRRLERTCARREGYSGCSPPVSLPKQGDSQVRTTPAGTRLPMPTQAGHPEPEPTAYPDVERSWRNGGLKPVGRRQVWKLGPPSHSCEISGYPTAQLDTNRAFSERIGLSRGVGVATLVTGAVGDDPGGWLAAIFGPVMGELAAIELAPSLTSGNEVGTHKAGDPLSFRFPNAPYRWLPVSDGSAAWDQFLPTVEVGTFGPSPSSRNS